MPRAGRQPDVVRDVPDVVRDVPDVENFGRVGIPRIGAGGGRRPQTLRTIAPAEQRLARAAAATHFVRGPTPRDVGTRAVDGAVAVELRGREARDDMLVSRLRSRGTRGSLRLVPRIMEPCGDDRCRRTPLTVHRRHTGPRRPAAVARPFAVAEGRQRFRVGANQRPALAIAGRDEPRAFLLRWWGWQGVPIFLRLRTAAPIHPLPRIDRQRLPQPLGERPRRLRKGLLEAEVLRKLFAPIRSLARRQSQPRVEGVMRH